MIIATACFYSHSVCMAFCLCPYLIVGTELLYLTVQGTSHDDDTHWSLVISTHLLQLFKKLKT